MGRYPISYLYVSAILEYESYTILQMKSRRPICKIKIDSGSELAEPVLSPYSSYSIHRSDIAYKSSRNACSDLQSHKISGVLISRLAQTRPPVEIRIIARLYIDSQGGGEGH